VRVLVTSGVLPGGPTPPGDRVRPQRAALKLEQAYIDAIRNAGGQALVLPPGADRPEALLDIVDAVVITGGAFDIHPSHYGRGVSARLDGVQADRTTTELELAACCMSSGVPVLGICGGLQALAVAGGGTLVQDIAAEVPGALEHEQPTDPATAWHPVEVTEGRLRSWLGSAIEVNSTHHQAVEDPGPFQVAGLAPDGVIEALVLPDHAFCVGVQWHPELLGDGRLYAALLATGR